MIRAIPLFFLVSLVSLACSKTSDKPVVADPPAVTIDSIVRTGFDNVYISASIKNPANETLLKTGFCWSTSQNPDTSDQVSDVASSLTFSDTIFDVGEKATIYFRAFLQTATGVYYSENKVVNTGGIEQSYFREWNDGRRRNIIDVVETPDNGFMELIIVVGTGIVWPEVAKLDLAGNVIWTKDFNNNAGENQFPDKILKVDDGYILMTTVYTQNTSSSIELIKIGFDGLKIWQKRFGKKPFQQLIRIASNPGSNVKLTVVAHEGFVPPPTVNCSIDEFILDRNGNIISESSKPVPTGQVANSLGFFGGNHSYGGYLLTGYHVSSNGINDELEVTSQDSLHEPLWQRFYKVGKDVSARCGSITPTGDFDLLCWVNKSEQVVNSYFIGIDKANGNKRWEEMYDRNEYGSPISIRAEDLVRDPTGNYFICGEIGDPDRPGAYVFIYKVAENGKRIWSHAFKTTKVQPSEAKAILTRAANEVYVFGSVQDQLIVGANALFTAKFIVN